MALNSARAAIALAALVAVTISSGTPQSRPGAHRMSFHNRLLLNRAVIAGLRTIEVLAVTGGRPGHSADSFVLTPSTIVEDLGGRILRSEPGIGYLRIELPIERVAALGELESVAAYQISSLSRGAWYRDGPPLSNAEMFRGFETAPVVAAPPPKEGDDLPDLTPEQARAAGYTGEGASLAKWRRLHPTYDGRGVTIALVESALPSFTDPTLRHARTLDGREVPKIAGILNVIDPLRADETRVRLERTAATRTAWTQIGGRTYVVPRPGRYSLGLLDLPAGQHVVHRFAVIENQETRDVWIDSDGDGSFQDEQPLADVNERFEPRTLKLRHPRPADVSVVMSRGREPNVIHIYVGRSSHQTMTASVAAGNATSGLASGVAPNARILFVRRSSSDPGLGGTFEAFLQAARDPRVDVISVSGGFTLVPDASSEFAAIFFSRLLRTYGKLIFNAAGNTSHALGSVHSYGDVLSVGGVMSPVTYAALYGGRPLERTIVHPISAAGPALDGAIKPDFLVPMERIATDLPWRASVQSLPRSAPEHRVPPGYQISCCTSATSPYAAGLAALLISAARQTGVRYSADGIARALRVTATALPDVPAHAQGNGVADINAAWRLLSNDADPPRIAASTHIAHPLAQYMVNGALGTGLFEFAGWFGGMRGNRTVTLRRTSGPAQPVNYTVSWTSGDGTFQSADDITLPLNAAAPLAVVIDVKSAGAHSALLNLVDPATGAVVFRSQATVAASEPFGASGSVRVTGTLPLLSQRAHYFHVPPGTSAIAFDLVVTRGVVGPTILRSHGLSGDYYPHVHPMNTFFDGPGRYHLVMPNPEPGTWTVKLDNRSVWANLAPAFGPRDGSDAEYALTVDLASSVVRTRAGRRNRLSVDVVNSGRPLRQPEIELWPATVLTSSGTFRSDGLPRTFEIAVAPETAALLLQVDSSRTTSELYLYDCTTGECFSYDIGFPAARSHRIVVRKPAAGRWIAAINAAPFPAAEGSFGFETVMTAGRPTRAALLQDRLNSWHAEVERPASISPGRGVPALLVQLVDRAIEADATGHPWSRAPHFIQLRDRPVAIGIAVHRR